MKWMAQNLIRRARVGGMSQLRGLVQPEKQGESGGKTAHRESHKGIDKIEDMAWMALWLSDPGDNENSGDGVDGIWH